MTSQLISRQLSDILRGQTSFVLACIGSDRVSGDSLGPMVGELLTSFYKSPCHVYGSLLRPLTAVNLVDTLNHIKQAHPNSSIIAVDSCVGKDIGTISVSSQGILAGSASGKTLPRVGDVGITAVTSDQVPSSQHFAYVRLGTVYKLALTIADGINQFLTKSSLLYTDALKTLTIRTVYQCR